MEKFFTINAEESSVRCKLYANAPGRAQRAILFGHGFGGHKNNRAAERFARRVLGKNDGVAVVTFDWPCHGDDARKALTLEACDLYLRLVTDHIRSVLTDGEIDGYATSFGGYLFLKYLSEHESPFGKLALRCPAVKMIDVITGAIMTDDDRARLERGKPVQVGFDRKVEVTRDFLESLRAADITVRDFTRYTDDILILHGTKDEIVPMASVEAFAWDNLLEFIPVEGADHRFMDPAKMDAANAQIISWFGLR